MSRVIAELLSRAKAAGPPPPTLLSTSAYFLKVERGSSRNETSESQKDCNDDLIGASGTSSKSLDQNGVSFSELLAKRCDFKSAKESVWAVNRIVGAVKKKTFLKKPDCTISVPDGKTTTISESNSTSERLLQPILPYAPMFDQSVTSFSELLSRIMPRSDNTVKAMVRQEKEPMLETKDSYQPFPLSPIDPYLLEHEHLEEYLIKVGVLKEEKRVYTTELLVSKCLKLNMDKSVEMGLAIDADKCGLIELVDALKRRKQFLLDQLHKSMDIAHTGPYVKGNSLFWEGVMQAIVEVRKESPNAFSKYFNAETSKCMTPPRLSKAYRKLILIRGTIDR